MRLILAPMIDLTLLSKICKAPGAPGFEQPIRQLLINEISAIGLPFKIDALGNLIVWKEAPKNAKKLLLTAHMDEIGFIVNHIDEEGFIRFLPLGGFDPKTLTAQRVLIHGRKEVLGVMGSKPIHLMTPEEKNKAPQIKDFYIDTGLPKEELTKWIGPGDAITLERELVQMGECINAKSLDNRISVFVLIEFLKAIAPHTLDVHTYVAFTVQEELGLRGAKSAAFQVAPDLAINVDTTIAYDVPGAQPHEFITKLGQGVAIKLYDSSALPDYRMVKFLKECAAQANITWQPELLAGGGTDTASVQLAGIGCIAGAISIPTRHIHQVIEMVHQKDVLGAIEFLQIVAKRIVAFDWNH